MVWGWIVIVVTEDEIYHLYDAFQSISKSQVDDGVIDEQSVISYFLDK